MFATRRRSCRLANRKSLRGLQKSILPKAPSFSRSWSWTRRARRGRRRRLWPCKIRPLAGKETLENARAEIRFRHILIRTNRQRDGVIRIVQLRFHRRDLVLLDEKKIAVEFVWHIVFLVITDAAEIIQHPR